jgi:hypothetical protein
LEYFSAGKRRIYIIEVNCSKSNLDYDIDDLIYKLTRVPKHKMPEALEELKALVSPEDYLKIIEQSNRNKAEYAKQILVNL